MNKKILRPALFLLNFLVLCLAAAFTPLERTLGENIRLIFLHGVWVWTALAAFGLAAICGLTGLLLRQKTWHRFSHALGLSGMAFWLTYLPMSLLVMQINWGGLFFDEPRWRIPMTFAIIGILMQGGLAFMHLPTLTSAGNLIFGAALAWNLNRTNNILHPDSPVSSSNSSLIQGYFIFLLALALLLGAQTALWIHHTSRKDT